MKKIRLTSICSPKQWKTIPTKDLLDEGYPVYGANGVIGYCKEYNHTSDTIIIGCRGSCGNVNIARGKSYINGNAMCLDDLSSDVDILYLYYFLQNYDFRSVISGTTIPQVTKQGLEKIDVVVSSKENQREIVRQLQLLDSIIEERHKELRYFDALIKSRFIELFGDPVYNTKKLPTKRLAELGSLDRGRSQHRPRNAPELLGGPYPLIQTGEVANAGLYITGYSNTYSELGLKQSKMWKAGTLCITIAANIAQTSILTFDACFPDSVVGFIPGDSISAIYMHYWFGFFQKILEEQAPQVAQKNINLKILSDLSVVVPNQEQQKDFIAFVEQTDKSKFEIQQSLEKLEILKKSLMQQYFG